MIADLKNILGVVAVLLTFVGYVPYLRDVIKGTTVPHLYSWFLWAFVTAIAFALQLSDQAGMGAFVTLAAAIMCGAVLVLGMFGKSKVEITTTDTLFLLAAFVALGLWLFAKQPVLSAILTTLIDLFGFAPTIRKSWNKPYTETLSFYYLNTLRFGLAVLSLQRYTIVTALYPVAWMFGNGLFALFLVIRRKQLATVPESSYAN